MNRNRRTTPAGRDAVAPRPAGRKPRPAGRRPGVEALETRCLLSGVTGYRPITEVGNNVNNPNWGTANTDLLRLAQPAYADGVAAPSLANDPSARIVSNFLNNQADPSNPGVDLNTFDQNSLSDFGYAFGQFMDHDMDLTPDGGASFPIPVPAGDPIGPGPLPFTRSQTDPNTGPGTGKPLQQVNVVTSYLDLSQVYGSDATTAAALRTLSGGLLKTSAGNMLPYDNSTYFPNPETPPSMQNAGGAPNTDLFATGDARGNENIELTALQTVFVRNHNRIAAELQQEHPGWTDAQLYQEARKINIADYQNIVYNEWIPAVLGADALPAYAGYNPRVNPGIATEFSTVAFRFGHSLLSGNIERHTNDGVDIATVNPNGAAIPLSQDFFDPYVLNPNGVYYALTNQTSSDIGAVLKWDADGVSQAMDLMAIRDVRNLLFGNFGAGGQDLMARDVQRARDDGIPGYNALRVAVGLAPATSFADITSDVQVQQEFRLAYGTVNGHDNVNAVDAFEGGLAEAHVPGSDVGPLFQRIMVNQFQRLRAGDRFFYLNENWTSDEAALYQQGNTLTKVIEANTNVTNLQGDAFLFKASIGGTVSLNLGGFSLGIPGLTVQLKDGGGNLLASTVTDFSGHYRFDQLHGIGATGDYTVSLVLPAGLTQTTNNPGTILISRGGLNVAGVDFGVAFNWQGGTATRTGGGSNSASTGRAVGDPGVEVAVANLLAGVKQTQATTGSTGTVSGAAASAAGQSFTAVVTGWGRGGAVAALSTVRTTGGAMTSRPGGGLTGPSGDGAGANADGLFASL